MHSAQNLFMGSFIMHVHRMNDFPCITGMAVCASVCVASAACLCKKAAMLNVYM